MKKIFLSIGLLLTVSMATVVFNACGDDKDEPKEVTDPTDPSNPNTILGTWKYVKSITTTQVKASNGTEESTSENVSSGKVSNMTLYEDGKVTAAYGVYTDNGTYTAKGSSFSTTTNTKTVAEGQTITQNGQSVTVKSHTYSVKDDTLKINLHTEFSANGATVTTKSVEVYTRVVESINLDETKVNIFLSTGYPTEATLELSVTPFNPADNATWTSSNSSVATISKGTIKALSAGKTTITANLKDKTATCEVIVFKISDDINGVVINGKRWATRNVDYPGTFADKITDYGKYYQWNSKIAWIDTDPMTSSDGSAWKSGWRGNNASSWQPDSDPSPAGWRVATKEEWESLFNAGCERVDTPVKGTVLGSLDNGIFLPEAGYRFALNSSLSRERTYYWTATTEIGGNLYGGGPSKITYYFDAYGVDYYNQPQNAGSVRCVKD
ncbi:MAG: Ig-like domain-containing protein [Prevotellaceae bacterium]|jgi:uncharacterized protein (TIGR02145 family)|nr:Ig-like domain-containing protein [Prevotellaceae bacterium]